MCNLHETHIYLKGPFAPDIVGDRFGNSYCVWCSLTICVCKLYSSINYIVQIFLCITYKVQTKKSRQQNKTATLDAGNIFFQSNFFL